MSSGPQARPAGPVVRVRGFDLALDRRYEPDTHIWVADAGPGLVRIGMDPLGAETSGTLAQISLPGVGADLAAGRPFGQLEAVKFVGPLTSPVSGTVRAVNDAVAADPGLIEAELASPAELDGLLADAAEITAWYQARIEDYVRTGAIAR